MRRRAFLRGSAIAAAGAALGATPLLTLGSSSAEAKGPRGTTPTPTPTFSPTPQPTPVPDLVASLFPVGKTAFGVFEPGAPWDMTGLLSLESSIAHKARIVHWFQGWGGSGTGVDTAAMRSVINRGSIPMITWEPWDWTKGISDTTYAPKNIAAGTFDSYIRSWATAIATYASPVIIRFAPEMNGAWSPWAVGVNGNTAADYVAAWRHVVSIFKSNGAANAMWVWCPTIQEAGVTPIGATYPSDGYVDLVGLDAYNAGTALNWGGWLSFASLFGPSLATLAGITSKPPMVCETGCAEQGGSKAAWVTDVLTTQIPLTYPQIRALVWFNQNKEADWRIESSTTSIAAFRSGLTASRYA